MSACTAEIDSVEVVAEQGSIQIDKRIEERSTANFTVLDLASSGAYVRGMPVQITDPDSTLIFAGFIDNPGRQRMSPSVGLVWDMTCMDNHYLADKRLVVKSYTDKTLAYIVNDIWTDYLDAEGITIGEFQTGPTIESAIFNYVKVSDAFDSLKEISGLTWYIDENKALYFIDRATNAASWDLDNSTYKPIGKPYLSTGNPLYRTRQYMRGGKGLTSEQTEVFIGDGTLQSFALGYPCALVPTSITDSVLGAGTIGIKGIDTGKDYYWSKGDSVIYCEIAPVAARTLTVVYYGQYPLIVLATNYEAQATRQGIEGGTGIVEEIVTETQHESADAMRESARTKLLLYCQEAERFVYQTQDSGLSPGQLQKITYSPFGFSAHEMLIESISITADGDELIYTVTCITGPVMGSWAKFFSNILTRQDKTIKIGDGLLLILLQQSETLELTEVTAIDEDEFAVSGQVNRWLNAAPIDAGSIYNIEHERLEMTEVTSEATHLTEDYNWDDADMLWGFFTWA